MTYQIGTEAAKLLTAGETLYATGSKAKVDGIAAVVIATQIERLASLSIPAANRPKVKDIQAAIRTGFGGQDKDGDRGRYEICSLAFRVLGKMEKAAEATLTQAMQNKVPAKLGEDLAALAGRYTEDALRAWVQPAAKGSAEKSAGEKLMAYLEKNGADLTETDMETVGAWVVKETARRASIRQALQDAEAA